MGILGHWVSVGSSAWIARVVVVSVGTVALVHELGGNRIPLPQLRRQTYGSWARQLPGPMAVALWGFDLGATFSTWLTFAGIWVLTVGVVISGDSRGGAAVFLSYWLGRALSVWITPVLLGSASATSELLRRVTQETRALQLVHAVGIVWATAIIAVWLV